MPVPIKQPKPLKEQMIDKLIQDKYSTIKRMKTRKVKDEYEQQVLDATVKIYEIAINKAIMIIKNTSTVVLHSSNASIVTCILPSSK